MRYYQFTQTICEVIEVDDDYSGDICQWATDNIAHSDSTGFVDYFLEEIPEDEMRRDGLEATCHAD